MTRWCIPLALAALAAGATTASAHISVSPEQAVLRESTEFTITVPAEGGLTTNAVRVFFPSQVSVYAVADAPGWTTRVLKKPDGRLRGAEWTGGLIPPNQYATFTVLGTPFEEGTSVWRSEQGLTNGKTKKWTGAPETGDEAAPETGPNAPGPAWAVQVVAGPTEAGGDGSSGGAVWLGVVGIALGVLALVGVGLVWSSRPAELPPDGPEDGPGR
jgi:uncharacterized protein YcnI